MLGVAYALSKSLIAGLLVALVAGSVFAAFVLVVRIWLEALLVVFRLGDYAAEMLEHEAVIALNTTAASEIESYGWIDRGMQAGSSEA